jgi:FlgD Ig-like domain
MSKIICIIFVSLFLTGLLFSSAVETASSRDLDLHLVQYQPGNFTQTLSREDVVFYSENFENGFPETWSTIDVTDPGSYWYRSPFNSFDDSLSWRVADSGIDGYRDSWYQVLDTPVITLPSSGDLVLSFEQFRAIEEPVGEFPANFDGWDGFNVRIRLADQLYEEAEILTDCDPAYNVTSLYSFGFIHNEDIDGEPGIPGWAGASDWTSTTIYIPSSYAGMDVVISFSFASDEATSTLTNPELTGVFLDDIDVAGVFFNDANSEEGFTGVTNTEIGGDLWHLYDESISNHIMGCFEAEQDSSYNPNMENYMITKTYSLPPNAEYSLDFNVQTAFDDQSFPNSDYFSVAVKYYSYGNWSNWNSISNPTGDPNVNNVVFTGSVSEWTNFSSGWYGYNDISNLAGRLVQFRIGLHSNNDQPDSLDFGIKFDDFQIIQTNYSAQPPTNLSGELFSNPFSVFLMWEPPENGTVDSYNLYVKNSESEEYEYLSLVSVTSYLHTDPSIGSNNIYVVSANMEDGDTDIGNSFTVYVPNETATVMSNDNGSCENSIITGIMNGIAANFEPNYSDTLALTHINFYIKDLNPGPVSLAVWQDGNGLPAELYPGFPLSVQNSDLNEGWNTLAIPEELQPPIYLESFFVGINFFMNSPTIGLDTDTVGNSYTSLGGWQMLGYGNIMVRAILDIVTDEPEPAINSNLPKISSVTNFPNPFNPETTISLNLNESEKVSVQVFNLKGQLVKTLIDEQLPAGISSILWNGKDSKDKPVSSGMYFYKIITNKEKLTGKMLLLK